MEREDVPPNSVNVKFVITEGEKVRVGQITFSGNKVYDDGKIQSSMKLVRERNMITIFTGRDKYAKLMLEADLEQNAKKLYQENGYVKVAFGEPTVDIKEGPRGHGSHVPQDQAPVLYRCAGGCRFSVPGRGPEDRNQQRHGRGENQNANSRSGVPPFSA